MAATLRRPSFLVLATQLAADAAALLLDGLDRDRVVVGTKSTPTDMVTRSTALLKR